MDISKMKILDGMMDDGSRGTPIYTVGWLDIVDILGYFRISNSILENKGQILEWTSNLSSIQYDIHLP